MKKKDVKLFQKVIHEAKFILTDIKKERDDHNKELRKMRKKHNDKMDKFIKEALAIYYDLNELFEDLYDGKEED